jgi:hypothetical protein
MVATSRHRTTEVWCTASPPRVESAGAAPARRGGTLSFDDLRGSRRQLDRPEFIVCSVEDVAPHPGVGSFDVASGALDPGAIEGCDVVVRRCCDDDLRREISQVEVAFSQGTGGDDVPERRRAGRARGGPTPGGRSATRRCPRCPLQDGGDASACRCRSGRRAGSARQAAGDGSGDGGEHHDRGGQGSRSGRRGR